MQSDGPPGAQRLLRYVVTRLLMFARISVQPKYTEDEKQTEREQGATKEHARGQG